MDWKVGILALCSFAIGCSSQPVDKKEYTDTEKAWMYISVANGALAQNDSTGALQALAQAEKLDGKIAELYHSKALAYFGKHDLSSAIAAARKAILLKPGFSEANNTLGSLFVSTGEYEQAMAPLLAAAQDPLFRESYRSWTNLGIMRFRQGLFSQAQVYFEHAILDSPEKSCGAYYYRGQIYQRDKKLNEAIEDFRRATKKFCARFGEASLALGLAYQKKREYTQARKTFLEIHERFPNTKLEEQAMNQLRFLP